MFDAKSNVDEKTIIEFGKLPFDKKILLSSGVDTKKYPFCFNLKCYENGYKYSLIKYKSDYSSRRYMYEFNLLKYINK